MLGFSRSRPGKDALVGIEFLEDGFAIAKSEIREGRRIVSLCEFVNTEMEPGERIDTLMANKVASLGLKNQPCNWVISRQDYSLLLIEAPAVDPAELQQAVRWRIKDLITFPVEDAVVDVLRLPEDGTRNSKHKMVYVAVSRRDAIESIINLTRRANLKLHSIDIAEMALRNLIELGGFDQRGAAIVRLVAGAGSIALVRRGQVYMSRQFDIGYNGGLLDEIPSEQLVLELQRSLDYYERQMGQTPPAKIFLCGENIGPEKISETLKNGLAAEIVALELVDLLKTEQSFDANVLQLCLGAIGGAFRQRAA